MLTRVPVEHDLWTRSQFVALGGRWPLFKTFQARANKSGDSVQYTMRGAGDEFRVTCAAVLLAGVCVIPLLASWYVSPVSDWIQITAIVGLVVSGLMVPWSLLKPVRTTRLTIDGSTDKTILEHRRGDHVLDEERLDTDCLWLEIVRIRTTRRGPWRSISEAFRWHGWMLTARDESNYWAVLATSPRLQVIEEYAVSLSSAVWNPRITIRPFERVLDVDISGMRAR